MKRLSILLLVAAFSTGAHAEFFPLTEEEALTYGKDVTKDLCDGTKRNHKGCTFKVSPGTEKGGWNILVWFIHSFDEQGNPRFMPEGNAIVFLKPDGTATMAEGNTPVPNPLPPLLRQQN